MPLGGRDLLLIIRATDRASGIIGHVRGALAALGAGTKLTAAQSLALGGALTALGAGITALGVKAVSFFVDAANAAKEYNRQSALTLTQVDELGVTLEQIKDIGKNVAAAIPAPFEQMQAALFDIFSSMEIGAKDAEVVLAGFAKAAVAGQTDVQTAGRATIAIMNAWQLGAEDLDHVLDVQFQLVRKGVGTYEEFATAIGRAIPAAHAAGQSIESLAAMMAFLTRSGLSTEQAATSAARALDLLKKPDVIKALHDIGVEVLNANGQFKQMPEIMAELDRVWGNLTDADRAAAFKEVFGTSTAQARRFFELAIPNSELLNELFGDMLNSGGAMADAYAIMAEQGASAAQLLSNNWAILKTEIGDVVLPVLNKLVEVGISIIQWFRDLDPEVQRGIVMFAAIASAALVLVGVITGLAGVFLIISGAASALAGIGLLPLLGIFTTIILVAAAVVAAGYLIYKNWDTIKATAEDVWPTIKGWIDELWLKMQQFWQWLYTNGPKAWQILQQVWDDVSATAVNLWHNFQEVWDNISKVAVDAWHTAQEVWDGITDVVVNAWHTFQQVWDWLSNTFGPGIVTVFRAIRDYVIPLIREFISTIAAVVDFISPWVKEIARDVTWLVRAIANALGKIGNYVEPFIAAFRRALAFFKLFVPIIQGIWNTISNYIAAVIKTISGIIKTVLAVIRGDWGAAWDGIKQTLVGIWEQIFSFLREIPGEMLAIGRFLIEGLWQGILAGLNLLWGLAQMIWDAVVNAVKAILGIGSPSTVMMGIGVDIIMGLWQGLVNTIGKIWDFFAGIGDAILDFFTGAITWLLQAGSDLLEGLWNGITAAAEAVWEFFTALPGKIAGYVVGIGTWLLQAGLDLLYGAWNGIVTAAQEVWNFFTELPGKILDFFAGVGSWLYDVGKSLIQGLVNGITGSSASLASAVNGVNAQINSIQQLQGISSPSKVQMYYGKMIVAGLAKGITDNASLVGQAMSRLSTTASLGGNFGATFSPTSFGAGGGTTVVNIADGAIQLSVGTGTDPEQFREIVYEALHDLTREIRSSVG